MRRFYEYALVAAIRAALLSAFGCKADMPFCSAMSAFDPKRIWRFALRPLMTQSGH